MLRTQLVGMNVNLMTKSNHKDPFSLDDYVTKHRLNEHRHQEDPAIMDIIGFYYGCRFDWKEDSIEEMIKRALQ